MPRPALTFARFVATPENRAAWLAVQDVADAFRKRSNAGEKPLLLHGPAGTGKTHLVQALVAEAAKIQPDLVACVLAAGELVREYSPTLFASENQATTEPSPISTLEEARHCDLLVVEDLQHLSLRAAESLVQLIDYLAGRRRPMIFTADTGPQRLRHRGERFPARLTSRLAAGLVVALEPPGPASRLLLLQTLAQRRQLAVPTEYLRWLADRMCGGVRQLEGIVARLQALVKLHRGQLDFATVEEQFREETDAGRVTVELIAERVGGYFHVDADDLQSQRRHRNVLLPRQVGMYLARELTKMSLEQIGSYFGGRDHSTVLHACRKVAKAVRRDAVLSGAVKEIHASLA